MDVKALKAQLDQTLNAARTLATKAASEDREFSDTEIDVAAELQRRALDLEARLKSAEKDAAVMAEIKRMGLLDIGVQNTPTAPASSSTKTAPVAPKVKAVGGSGDWGAAVVKANSTGMSGFKSLIPSGAAPVTIPLMPEPVRLGEPVLALRQLIPSRPDNTGRWSYLKQSVRTNNATVVAPGAKKPTSIYSLVRVEERARTIAHLSEPLHRADLDDAAMLQSFIDTELRLGLEIALEDQLVNGSGVGENLTGLANVSGSQSQAWSNDVFETTRKAITKLEVLSINGTGWVFSPADWEMIELLANNEGDYMLGGGAKSLPVDRAARRLWGIPVAVSTAVTAGAGYLADFAGSTELRIREDAVVDWSENVYDPNKFGAGEGGSDFEANMLRFRCEGRFGFAITRPFGVVEIDLTP